MKTAKFSLLTVILSTAFATTALAHRFEVLLIASDPATAVDTYDGFRLATRERDGHADEESDGHLGGLDVYINTPAKGETAIAALAGGTFDLVAVIGKLADDGALQSAIRASGAVMVPVASVSPAMESEFLGPDQGGAFNGRFEAAENRAATPPATLSYIAARLIDLAVRPQEGVEDRAAMRAVIAEY
ncbi:MAG: hypothetical protein GXP03_11510 [Alphaproteobacteria bacterium]|nr:hypothetical protein [Alphaproteobacteria bacterium]